jgi:hypothetical protein
MKKALLALLALVAFTSSTAFGDLVNPNQGSAVFSSAAGGSIQQVGLVARFFDNAGNFSVIIQGDGNSLELPATNPKPILEACERHALLAKMTARPFYLKLVQGAVRRCGVN